jgi:hypothetical protein
VDHAIHDTATLVAGPGAATALLLGLTNPATGQSSDRATWQPSPLTGTAKALHAAGAATSGHHGDLTVVADRLNNRRGLDLRHGPCTSPRPAAAAIPASASRPSRPVPG